MAARAAVVAGGGAGAARQPSPRAAGRHPPPRPPKSPRSPANSRVEGRKPPDLKCPRPRPRPNQSPRPSRPPPKPHAPPVASRGCGRCKSVPGVGDTGYFLWREGGNGGTVTYGGLSWTNARLLLPWLMNNPCLQWCPACAARWGSKPWSTVYAAGPIAADLGVRQ